MGLVIPRFHLAQPSSGLRPYWRRLRLADAEASGDPNSVLDTVTDTEAGGFNVALLDAGVATLEPGAAAWWTWPLLDTLGAQPDGEDNYLLETQQEEVTVPGLTTDTVVYLGVLNESDPSTATVDGTGVAIQYTGGGRTLVAWRLVNGAITSLTGAGDPLGVRVQGIYPRAGQKWANVTAISLDADGRKSATGLRNNGLTQVAIPGSTHLVYAVGRTAATAGAVPSVAQIPRYVAHAAPVSGRIP